jgi:hypothetical protein
MTELNRNSICSADTQTSCNSDAIVKPEVQEQILIHGVESFLDHVHLISPLHSPKTFSSQKHLQWPPHLHMNEDQQPRNARIMM